MLRFDNCYTLDRGDQSKRPRGVYMPNSGQTDIVMGNIVPLREKIKELEVEISCLEHERDDLLWFKSKYYETRH